MTAHTTRGSLVEVRTTRESWQRGVVVRAEPDCDMLLVRLRSGASTAWTFGDVCRPDSAPRKPAASPAASSSGAAASSSGAAVGTAPPTAAGMGFVEQPQAGQCVGTLRWDDRKQFPPLPAWPAECAGTPPALVGWRDYLEMRLPPDGEGTIRVEPPMLDGASYPLSLLHALQELRLRPPSHEPLTVLLIGASSKAEARLLHDSNYWCELAHFLPAATLHLVFVGPEIDATSGAPMQLAPRLSAECVRGTLGALLQARPQLSAANSLLVGFNTGMGNGLLALMQSWLPDLCEISRRELVAIFTCANDYADLKGELLVWKLLGAQQVMPPRRNPFKAATVVRAPETDASVEWSCSSCFMYAVRGRAEGAPPLPPANDPTLQKALKRLAKHHRETQKPSPVP